MYEAFYGFTEKPFNLTPDPRFLYLSDKHSEAFAHLEFGLKQRGGFIVVTGEVGTGKTTLCRYFLERLDEETVSAFILYPALTAKELLDAVCDDLGVEGRGATAKETVDALHRFLLAARERGKNIVLVIDEAQNLSSDVLEQIRLISNLETATEKLIQIVLLGQSELNDLLARNDLRQLAQRVTARYHLRPLDRDETSEYIRHRLAVASGIGKVSFTKGALRAVYRYSQGVPRLINLLCDRVLLAGFVLGRRDIDARLVRRAIEELTAAGTTRPPWYRRWLFRAAGLGLVLGVALGLGLGPWGLGGPSAGSRVEERAVGAPVRAAPDRAGLDADAGPVRVASGTLAERILRLDEESSRRAAAAVLLASWGVELGGGVEALAPEESLASLASRCGLEYTELATHLDQLRRLNLPAIVELFHPERDSVAYATLVGLGPSTATLAFGPGDTVEIAPAALELSWTRRAVILWKDFEGGAAEDGGRAPATAWVETVLQERGFLDPDGPVDREAFRAAVARFQAERFLAASGIVGPQTRMALYGAAAERYRVPRLAPLPPREGVVEDSAS